MLMHELKVCRSDIRHPKQYAQGYYEDAVDCKEYDKVMLTCVKEEVWEIHEQREQQTGAW